MYKSLTSKSDEIDESPLLQSFPSVELLSLASDIFSKSGRLRVYNTDDDNIGHQNRYEQGPIRFTVVYRYVERVCETIVNTDVAMKKKLPILANDTMMQQLLSNPTGARARSDEMPFGYSVEFRTGTLDTRQPWLGVECGTKRTGRIVWYTIIASTVSHPLRRGETGDGRFIPRTH